MLLGIYNSYKEDQKRLCLQELIYDHMVIFQCHVVLLALAVIESLLKGERSKDGCLDNAKVVLLFILP
jgi:hypothetical protein